jgi:hypothetical protein
MIYIHSRQESLRAWYCRMYGVVETICSLGRYADFLCSKAGLDLSATKHIQGRPKYFVVVRVHMSYTDNIYFVNNIGPSLPLRTPSRMIKMGRLVCHVARG